MDTLRNRAEQCTTLTQYTEILSLCKTGLFKEEERTLWNVDTAPPAIVFVVREGEADNSDYWRWMAIQAVLLQEAYAANPQTTRRTQQ